MPARKNPKHAKPRVHFITPPARHVIAPPEHTLITRRLPIEREHIGRRLTALQQRLLDAQNRLNIEDERQGNVHHAIKHADLDDLHHLFDRGKALGNNRMRIAVHYAPIHALLETISKGKLAGRNILHLASSTGVYAKFLQDEAHARVVALDLDKQSVKEAKTRGVKWNVSAQGVHQLIPSGRWVAPPGKIILEAEHINVRLPFKDKCFDFVVSDHFLFSNFHPSAGGFEHEEGSIKKSEDTLIELNRILRKNGRVVIGETHIDETPDLRRYQRKFRIHGFVVEAAYDGVLKPIRQGQLPSIFVLRKVSDLPAERKK